MMMLCCVSLVLYGIIDVAIKNECFDDENIVIRIAVSMGKGLMLVTAIASMIRMNG